MKTHLDCLPCFLKQTLQAARLSTDNPELQRDILNSVSTLLTTLDFKLSPPENSVFVYETIARLSGCADPFHAIKDQSNRFAKNLEPQLITEIKESEDPIHTAFLYSIAGNSIDYGANHDGDPEQIIQECRQHQFKLDSYKAFRKELKEAKTLLYLADNSGEIVFDTLVIRQLQRLYPKLNITLAVKKQPIINDALMADALFCDLPHHCTVIDNGTGCPGAPLAQCSAEFNDYFDKADIIISKGQGNFETLSEQKGLYFLLICKCPVVGNHITKQSNTEVALGDLIFYKSE